MISYSEAIAITQNPIFIILILISWLTPILLFTLIAIVNKKRTSGGTFSIRPMIKSGSLLWTWVIGIVVGGFFSALIIFPVFLKLAWLSNLFP